MRDVSRRVYETRHENGSTEYLSAVCHLLFALNSVTVPPQHVENFSRPLEMMQCQEHKTFAGTKYFLKAEPSLKMSGEADGRQQHGHVTTQHEYENLFDPIEDWAIKMIADEVNVNREAVGRILTEELRDERKFVPRRCPEI